MRVKVTDSHSPTTLVELESVRLNFVLKAPLNSHVHGQVVCVLKVELTRVVLIYELERVKKGQQTDSSCCD